LFFEKGLSPEKKIVLLFGDKLPQKKTLKKHAFRASPIVLYQKFESGKKWKDMNSGSGQQGRNHIFN
jgi:hypothetical protein